MSYTAHKKITNSFGAVADISMLFHYFSRSQSENPCIQISQISFGLEGMSRIVNAKNHHDRVPRNYACLFVKDTAWVVLLRNVFCRFLNRVGQSREILDLLFGFGSTFATALAVSEAYPTAQVAACVVVASSIQNTKLFTWRTWPCVGAVPKSDWAARSQCEPNSGVPITPSTFDIFRRITNSLSLLNWWSHKYDNEDDYALFQ